MNGYMLPQELPLTVMLIKQKITLKILATLEILRKLQPCHCDYIHIQMNTDYNMQHGCFV